MTAQQRIDRSLIDDRSTLNHPIGVSGQLRGDRLRPVERLGVTVSAAAHGACSLRLPIQAPRSPTLGFPCVLGRQVPSGDSANGHDGCLVRGKVRVIRESPCLSRRVPLRALGHPAPRSHDALWQRESGPVFGSHTLCERRSWALRAGQALPR
jgi:hypothetical protein